MRNVDMNRLISYLDKSVDGDGIPTTIGGYLLTLAAVVALLGAMGIILKAFISLAEALP
jgi:hypothetical protein